MGEVAEMTIVNKWCSKCKGYIAENSSFIAYDPAEGMPHPCTCSSNIITFPNKDEQANILVRQIKEAVYSHAGMMSTAEAFGCIEIAKRDLERELLDYKQD
jgi:hypothetical protein